MNDKGCEDSSFMMALKIHFTDVFSYSTNIQYYDIRILDGISQKNIKTPNP
jgi:hypothetical protein